MLRELSDPLAGYIVKAGLHLKGGSSLFELIWVLVALFFHFFQL